MKPVRTIRSMASVSAFGHRAWLAKRGLAVCGFLIGCLASSMTYSGDDNCAAERLPLSRDVPSAAVAVVALYYNANGQQVAKEDLYGTQERCYRDLIREEDEQCPTGTCAVTVNGTTYCRRC